LLPRVLITSPYPDFTKLTEDICRELSVEPVIIEAVLEDAVQKVLKITGRDEIEVVVSRGGTAAALKNNVSVPVITAEASDYDILQALWEAKNISSKIAFLGSYYHQGGYEFKKPEKILGINIKQYLYRNYEELENMVLRAYEDGMEVVVGGGQPAVNMAKAMGMRGILIYSSRRSIVQAIERAKEVIRIRRHDRKYTQRLRTVVNSVEEAVILVDEQERVMFINRVAERILGLDNRVVMNKQIKELNNLWLAGVYKDGTPCDGHLQELDNTKVVVNRYPVNSKNENFGVVVTFQELTRLQQLEQKTRREIYHKGLVARFSFDDVIGESRAIREAIETAKKYGHTDSTVLITGETGTGKELMAQGIHNISSRKEGPFVAVNCAALPENLLESELFGYEEGAFTGAKKGGKLGLFELAHGGTIFLDEIGKIPFSLQGRLLRVLQEKEVMRLGGSKVIPVNVRVIAATNLELSDAVQKGDFRADLYYRLNVLKLKLPPLREREGDIELLTNHFISSFNEKFRKNVKYIPKEIRDWINQYQWPGNVRELENFIERLVVLSNGQSLNKNLVCKIIENADEGILLSASKDCITVQIGTLEEMEKEIIKKMDKRLGFKKNKLAKKLGVSRTTLWKKLNDYDQNSKG